MLHLRVHSGLVKLCHAQGVLTPFDCLNGYERKIQSGPAEAPQASDAHEPSAGSY